MKNQVRKLHMKLKGKKRYVLIPLLAMELAALPAAAQIVHKVAFEIRPMVTAVEIPTAAKGKRRFLVTSNAPFSVEAASMVGDLNVSVHRSGMMNTQRFGDNAQFPGTKQNCAVLISPSAVPVYSATQKTASTKGSAVSQAVIFEFRFDPSAAPDLKFIAGDIVKPMAEACASSNT